MKTAISVPTPVFERVERRVKELGLSRSEFYSRAAEHFLRALDNEDLTAQFDSAIRTAGEASAAEQREWAAQASRALVTDDEW